MPEYTPNNRASAPIPDAEEFKYEPETALCPDKPLFMPTGSVRAFLAIIIVGAFIGVCIQTKNMEALAVIATMIAKDYFQSRE